MLHKRHRRVVGHVVLLALFLLVGLAVLRFLLGILDTIGWSPDAVFALLLFAGVVALVWRSVIDLRRAVRRL
ncbi:MAG: hypothetical protein GEU90_21160 [Gemmatimonas sp.]|nr:hypothetical protein [Gemmatimonas sp.]